MDERSFQCNQVGDSLFSTGNQLCFIYRLRHQLGEPDYNESVTEEDETGIVDQSSAGSPGLQSATGNSLYDEAVALVVREQKASTSFVQRHLKIGYNRAATLVEEMESAGIISAANHVGKREVLIQNEDI